MKKLVLNMGLMVTVALGLGGAFAAIADTAVAAKPSYTPAERKQREYSMWLSGAAYSIAGYKQHGDPAAVPKKFYAADPRSTVLKSLVDTVYANKVTNPWDYAGQFYQDCACTWST